MAHLQQGSDGGLQLLRLLRVGVLDGLPASRAAGKAQHRIISAGVPINRDLRQAAGTCILRQCAASLANANASAKLPIVYSTALILRCLPQQLRCRWHHSATMTAAEVMVHINTGQTLKPWTCNRHPSFLPSSR